MSATAHIVFVTLLVIISSAGFTGADDEVSLFSENGSEFEFELVVTKDDFKDDFKNDFKNDFKDDFEDNIKDDFEDNIKDVFTPPEIDVVNILEKDTYDLQKAIHDERLKLTDDVMTLGQQPNSDFISLQNEHAEELDELKKDILQSQQELEKEHQEFIKEEELSNEYLKTENVNVMNKKMNKLMQKDLQKGMQKEMQKEMEEEILKNKKEIEKEKRKLLREKKADELEEALEAKI